MENDDFRMSMRILYEILSENNSNILDIIRSLKLSAICDSSFNILSESIMKEIKEKLIEWKINIPSFECITLPDNSSESFRCLLEIVQSVNYLDFKKIENIFSLLKKPHKDLNVLYDCFHFVPELIEELEKTVEKYKEKPDIRLSIRDSLRKFSTNLYVILTDLLVQLSKYSVEQTSEINKALEEYIMRLVRSSFVIFDYPPKIIKKRTQKQSGTHFNASISCLIDKEKMFVSNPTINAYFMNEDNLKSFITTKNPLREWKITCSDIRKNNDNSWVLRLVNMIWDPILQKTKERKKSNRITTIKAIILFRISIIANPYALKKTFEVRNDLFSDSLISVVHTNQEVDAHLTLFWDEYFRIDKSSLITKGDFECLNMVNVTMLIDAISDYFLKQTSRGLTESNRKFLEQRFQKLSKTHVTFDFFTRTHMPDSEYSFGYWIFSIIKLIKMEGSIGMWKNNLIDGFVSKDIENSSDTCRNGTFFLRFSEKNSKIGIVLKIEKRWNAWTPFSLEECRSRSLPERLMDYSDLQMIRNADGMIYNKMKALSCFIDERKPEDGYTQRGSSSRLVDDGYIYKNEESNWDSSNIDEDDDPMGSDDFIGINLRNEKLFDDLDDDI